MQTVKFSRLTLAVTAMLLTLPQAASAQGATTKTAQAVAAQGDVIARQPACLDPIGLWKLQQAYPDATGVNARVALVELADAPGQDATWAFLPNLAHQALAAANVAGLYYYGPAGEMPGLSGHATMIAGMLAGSDDRGHYGSVGTFSYQGMAPEALLSVYEAKWFLYKQILSGTYGMLGDDVVSISWGTERDDAFTRWWQRGIDAAVVRQGVFVAAACGNGEAGLGRINKPSWGYNVVSVGTAQSLGTFPNNLRYVGPPSEANSSFGPTQDGRCKPDLLAVGMYLGLDADSDGGYCRTSGGVGYSSFATPQVAGAAALLVDGARRLGLTGGDDPRVVKALLLNGANKLIGWHKGYCDPADDHQTPLDFRQGAGLLDVWNSYRQLLAGAYGHHSGGRWGWDLGEVAAEPDSPDAQRIYHVGGVIEAGQYVKATLVWQRQYDNSRAYNGLGLDLLGLELWTLDAAGQLAERLDYSVSRVDNVQHLYYPAAQQLRAALVVRLLEGGSGQTVVRYGLAYSGEDEGWRGDQWAADLNVDGVVDMTDLLRFMHVWRWHKEHPEAAEAALGLIGLAEDLNGDGRVERGDFEQFAQEWQLRSPWAAAGAGR